MQENLFEQSGTIEGFVNPNSDNTSPLITVYTKGDKVFVRYPSSKTIPIDGQTLSSIKRKYNYIPAQEDSNTNLGADEISFAIAANNIIVGTPKKIKKTLEDALKREKSLKREERSFISKYILSLKSDNPISSQAKIPKKIDAYAYKFIKRAQNHQEPYTLDELTDVLSGVVGKGSFRKLYDTLSEANLISLNNMDLFREDILEDLPHEYNVSNEELAQFIAAVDMDYVARNIAENSLLNGAKNKFVIYNRLLETIPQIERVATLGEDLYFSDLRDLGHYSQLLSKKC